MSYILNISFYFGNRITKVMSIILNECLSFILLNTNTIHVQHKILLNITRKELRF